MPRNREDYVSLYTLVHRNDSKERMWQIFQTDESVYRFSSFTRMFLRQYLEKLLSAHRKGKTQTWNDLKNILFEKGEGMHLTFLNKPIVRDAGDLQQLKKADFEALADFLVEIKTLHSLRDFPTEISKFISLLRNPIGNLESIKNHYALHDSEKRVDLIYTLQRLREDEKNYDFRARTTFLDNEALLRTYTRKNHFREVFIGMEEFEEIYNKHYGKGKNVGNEDRIYQSTLRDLVRFLRNFMEHRRKEHNESDSDLEWKVYCYFPFYTWLVCEKLFEVGLHRLT